jgi:hypothetical protein
VRTQTARRQGFRTRYTAYVGLVHLGNHWAIVAIDTSTWSAIFYDAKYTHREPPHLYVRMSGAEGYLGRQLSMARTRRPLWALRARKQ